MNDKFDEISHSSLIDILLQKFSSFSLEKGNVEFEDEIDDNEIKVVNSNNGVTNKNQSKIHQNLKQDRKDKVKDWISCKRPVYENCGMLAPDGELLCYCDKRKMGWYIERKLATIISEEPPLFKLHFEPNSRGSHPDDISSKFYLNHRKNCCVVCGKEDNYMRFHIVPVMYRKFFPHEYKSHNSHDIVLLCLVCHESANKVHGQYKEIISKKFNVPLNNVSDEVKAIKSLHNHISFSRALCRNYETIPLDKKEELSEEIIKFINSNENNDLLSDFYDSIFKKNNIHIPLKKEELTKDILYSIVNYKMKKSTQKEKKNMHGKIVVNSIKDFHNFIKEWRKAFMECMNPQFLPDNWDIEHDFYSSFGRQSKFFKPKLEELNKN